MFEKYVMLEIKSSVLCWKKMKQTCQSQNNHIFHLLLSEKCSPQGRDASALDQPSGHSSGPYIKLTSVTTNSSKELVSIQLDQMNQGLFSHSEILIPVPTPGLKVWTKPQLSLATAGTSHTHSGSGREPSQGHFLIILILYTSTGKFVCFWTRC